MAVSRLLRRPTAILVLIAVRAVSLAKAQCQTPLKACDFFFDGSRTAAPTLSILNASPEKPLSRAIVHQSGVPIISATIGPPNACQAPAPVCQAFCTVQDGVGGMAQGPFTRSSMNKIGIRPTSPSAFRAALLRSLHGDCVTLPLNNIQIKMGSGSNNIVSLKTRDGNTYFPQKRRCITFRLSTL